MHTCVYVYFLQVIDGVVTSSETDRFGALIRGYLAYQHLVDGSLQHYNGQ